MSTRVRLAAFAAGLALVFAASFGLGRAIGPVGPTSAAPPAHERHEVTR